LFIRNTGETSLILFLSQFFLLVRVARNNNQKSGSHDDFQNFILGLPWILFYHERMGELGDDLSLYFNIAYPSSLDDTVFMTSDGMTQAPSTQKTWCK